MKIGFAQLKQKLVCLVENILDLLIQIFLAINFMELDIFLYLICSMNVNLCICVDVVWLKGNFVKLMMHEQMSQFILFE